MKQLFVASSFAFVLAALALPSLSAAQSVPLGGADSFAVLGGSTVTSTGLTVVDGDLGVSPGTAITGFPPGIVNGTIYAGGAVADTAHADAATAYGTLAGLAFTQDLTGQGLGGLTLLPGVYNFDSSAQLTGILTLDSGGDANARFVFQIGSTLTSATGASVLQIGGISPNVYWQVGTSATLGTMTDFRGTIIADQSITLNAGTNILYGRALAINGAVTMDGNHVSTVPEPSVMAAMFTGIGALALRRRRR